MMEAKNLEPHREGGNGLAQMSEELSLSKREGFRRETCFSWRQQVGKSSLVLLCTQRSCHPMEQSCLILSI